MIITSQGFYNLLDKTAERMADAKKYEVKTLIKSGHPVVSLGRYYEHGPMVISVSRGDGTNAMCQIQDGKQDKTLSWVKHQYPDAEIAW